MFTRIKTGFLSGLAAACMLAACAATSPPGDIDGRYSLPSIKHQGRTVNMDEMTTAIASARAVLVGESHDRFDHHLNQLEIVERLHEALPDLAIGMEQFQQPFQHYLDEFVAGSIDTEAMLLGTEYYQRWRHDYRLYEPILSYVRRHRIPVVALNLPGELTRKVAAGGLAALDNDEAVQVPELDRSNEAYRKRLREIYREHPMSGHGGSFDNFYTVQLLWDEGMAARAADYLKNNPGHMMVILAGNGHIEFGSGIPDRLARRIDGDVVTVINADESGDQADRADYVLDSSPVELPDRGLLGVMIDPDSRGARVNSLNDNGAAGAAGVKAGDVIVAVDGHAISGLADLRVRTWDKQPGDRVPITVLRDPDESFRFDVTLR